MSVSVHFGPAWGPITDGSKQIETPVGQQCFWCQEPIAPGDRGTFVPVSRLDGFTVDPQHRECGLRAVIGSIAHLEKRCSCYGGPDDDDSTMTDRQEALAVWDWVQHHGVDAIGS